MYIFAQSSHVLNSCSGLLQTNDSPHEKEELNNTSYQI